VPLPADCERLAVTLRRALEELAEHYENVERKFDDAAWVGARLTELLPIELTEKQALLELEDPIERVRTLMTVVKE
jgi:Lon protease-like protein